MRPRPTLSALILGLSHCWVVCLSETGWGLWELGTRRGQRSRDPWAWRQLTVESPWGCPGEQRGGHPSVPRPVCVCPLSSAHPPTSSHGLGPTWVPRMRQSQGWGGHGWEASAGGQEGAVFHMQGEPFLEAPTPPTASQPASEGGCGSPTAWAPILRMIWSSWLPST